MEWLKNLSKAIEYIESNLDQEISYDEAARIACCSTYYFQRMFSYVAGIPLSEYIRRRKMTQAAFELQTSDVKIMDIALKYGYASPTAFNRAFQKVHGLTPVAAKSRGSVLNAYPPIRFTVQVTGSDALTYRIEEMGAVRMVGYRLPLKEDMEYIHKIVPPIWEEFRKGNQITELCALSDQGNGDIYGITAYRGKEDFYYYIAVKTDQPAPEGMFECFIPDATWAVFEMNGPCKESVQNVFRRFYTEWLPFSGYTYAELPDIEVYPEESRSGSGYSEVRIALKREKES